MIAAVADTHAALWYLFGDNRLSIAASEFIPHAAAGGNRIAVASISLAEIVCLNWWNVFMRLGIPEKHAEAITSRPLALHGIARLTRHAKAPLIAAALNKVSGFLKQIKRNAEQLTQSELWRLILSVAFQIFLGGRALGSTVRLA